MKVKECLRHQTEALFAAMAVATNTADIPEEAKVAEAQEVCRLLLAFVLLCAPKELVFHKEEELTPEQEVQFCNLCERAKAGYPVQYLIGEQEFMSLPFTVGEGVLIPRWETELLVEKALELLPKEQPVVIADICTGSGAIGVSLCHYLPDCYCFAVDISEAALVYAQANSVKNKVADRMEFFQGDLLCPLPVRQKNNPAFALDMILSNPPYVTEKEMRELPLNVQYEPKLALFGGEDGLVFYLRLAAEAPALLKQGGWLCVECGHLQGEAIKQLWEKKGFVHVEILKDYAGKDRMVIGQKK